MSSVSLVRRGDSCIFLVVSVSVRWLAGGDLDERVYIDLLALEQGNWEQRRLFGQVGSQERGAPQVRNGEGVHFGVRGGLAVCEHGGVVGHCAVAVDAIQTPWWGGGTIGAAATPIEYTAEPHAHLSHVLQSLSIYNLNFNFNPNRHPPPPTAQCRPKRRPKSPLAPSLQMPTRPCPSPSRSTAGPTSRRRHCSRRSQCTD